MFVTVLSVIALSIAFTVGAGTTYAWLSRTHAWSFIATHQLEFAIALLSTAGLTLLNMSLRWLRWTFLLRRFHARVPTRETFQLFFATAVLVMPWYLGELLRGAAIARRYRELSSVIFWVWLVERSSDVAALLVIWGFARRSPELWIVGLVLLIGSPWLVARSTLRQPGAAHLHTAQISTASIIVLSVALSLVAWALPVAALHGILCLLNGASSVDLAGYIFSSGTLLGGLTGVPGGLGTTGSVMIERLTAADVAPSVASVSIFVLRLGTQWFAFALGVVLTVLWFRKLRNLVNTSGRVQAHFDALAPSYSDDIPEHYRQQMLERKIDAMVPKLPTVESHPRGLDLGCGHGWYASELARLGYQMHGIDLSQGQVDEAKRYCHVRQTEVMLTTYDGVHLPYPDNYFDFAYSINVFHHVPSPEAQRDLMAEILRVLKPEGQFLLHEMNVENMLFRGYMSYIFPLLKSIDEGTELWIRPTRLPSIPGGRWEWTVRYFTFTPEFLPAVVLRWARPLERWLETSPLRKYSAHYMATLLREATRQN